MYQYYVDRASLISYIEPLIDEYMKLADKENKLIIQGMLNG